MSCDVQTFSRFASNPSSATEVTDNDMGLLGNRRLAEFAYALPRTHWNVGVNQRFGGG